MKKLLAIVLGLSLFFAPVSGAEVASSSGESAQGDQGSDSQKSEIEELTQVVQQSTLLLQLKQKLAQIKYRLAMLQRNVEEAKVGLVDVRAAVSNLEKLVLGYDAQIKDADHKILSVKSQKERKKMELRDLEDEVELLKLKLEDQKELVSELMTLLYVKRGVYYDEEGVNVVKVLASPDSVSETLQKVTYLDLIESENQEQIDQMAQLSTELGQKWGELREKREQLDELDLKLAEDHARLEGEKQAQVELLEETKAEEAIFEAMLANAGDREEDLLREIRIYETNIETMEGKLTEASENLDQDQLELISRIEEDMMKDFDVEEAANYLELDWPVSPSRGLTAYFIDGAYQALFGVQHYALDIRAEHGSAIFAPADGVVSEVVFDETSNRYAFIQIAHRKGVMTLYGHISDVAVSAGDYVIRGQIIGLSGGTPRTVGSGVRTTGPHLHFEVWQDGVRVDPLRYLPLEEVPTDSLPEEFVQELKNDLEEQIKEITTQLGL